MKKDFNVHVSLRPILQMAQCFGLFPLQGIHGEIEDLKFSWKSWRIIHSILVLCGIAFCDIACLTKTFEFGIKMFKFGKTQFGIQVNIS